MKGAFFLLVVMSVIALLIKKFTSKEKMQELEVIKKNPLSKREQEFFWLLKKTLPDHIILAQVDLKQLIEIGSTKDRQKHMNKISQRSIDFVICNKDFLVLAAIELDDSSHNSKSQKKKDEVKTTYIEAANIPFKRYRKPPSTEEIVGLTKTLDKHFLLR
ncbi:MAG: DUF2726 domain-containing protein [Nitrospinae bacterium]|nr:DUF2726 domain-containing protein [Nitrospinota bacterium]